MREYRIEELANATGTTVRTLQAYRTRGLLPPPRKQGRVVFYSSDHIQRLDLIADLIARGYSLNAISELLHGLDRGDRIHDLVGLGDALAPAVSPDDQVLAGVDIATGFGGADAIADLIALGVIESVDREGVAPVETGDYRVVLPATLEAGLALIAAGIPRAAVLRRGIAIRRHAEIDATALVEMVTEHVIADGAVTAASRSSSISELVEQLAPFAATVAAESLRAALTQQIRDEIDRQLAQLLSTEPNPPDA